MMGAIAKQTQHNKNIEVRGGGLGKHKNEDIHDEGVGKQTKTLKFLCVRKVL